MIFLIDADGGGQRRPSHRHDFPYGFYLPSWSPDGRWIEFVAAPGHYDSVYVVDVAGGRERPVTKQAYTEGGFAWHRDGGLFYAVRSHRPGSTALTLSAPRRTSQGRGRASKCPSLACVVRAAHQPQSLTRERRQDRKRPARRAGFTKSFQPRCRLAACGPERHSEDCLSHRRPPRCGGLRLPIRGIRSSSGCVAFHGWEVVACCGTRGLGRRRRSF